MSECLRVWECVSARGCVCCPVSPCAVPLGDVLGLGGLQRLAQLGLCQECNLSLLSSLSCSVLFAL